MASSNPPKSFGLLLFEGFQVLDAAGPMDCLNILAMFMEKDMKVSVLAKTMDPVTPGPVDKSLPGGAFNGQQLYKPTHTFDDAPQLDVLIVPGGRGCRAALQEEVDFIKKVHDGYDGKPPAQYLFSICTGSALFARAGVLNGVRATSNKRSWKWVTEQSKSTHWIAKARWVEDGRIWTCSGVSAGIDGMVAWIARIHGEQTAQEVCNIIEHTRVKESGDDPFAELNGCEDVPAAA